MLIKKRIALSPLLTFLVLFLLPLSVLQANHSPDESYNEGNPFIQFDQTEYFFPPVFEGTMLSHSFSVTNNGTADLTIQDVEPS